MIIFVDRCINRRAFGGNTFSRGYLISVIHDDIASEHFDPECKRKSGSGFEHRDLPLDPISDELAACGGAIWNILGIDRDHIRDDQVGCLLSQIGHVDCIEQLSV